MHFLPSFHIFSFPPFFFIFLLYFFLCFSFLCFSLYLTFHFLSFVLSFSVILACSKWGRHRTWAVSPLLPRGQVLMFLSLRPWRLISGAVKKLPFHLFISYQRYGRNSSVYLYDTCIGVGPYFIYKPQTALFQLRDLEMCTSHSVLTRTVYLYRWKQLLKNLSMRPTVCDAV
jgi:hypothetical protein